MSIFRHKLWCHIYLEYNWGTFEHRVTCDITSGVEILTKLKIRCHTCISRAEISLNAYFQLHTPISYLVSVFEPLLTPGVRWSQMMRVLSSVWRHQWKLKWFITRERKKILTSFFLLVIFSWVLIISWTNQRSIFQWSSPLNAYWKGTTKHSRRDQTSVIKVPLEMSKYEKWWLRYIDHWSIIFEFSIRWPTQWTNLKIYFCGM